MRGDNYERLVAQETLILEATEAVCEAMEPDQDQGVTRKELAYRLGCGKSHVTQLLSGERNLTLRTVADLASALDQKATITFEPLPGGEGESVPTSTPQSDTPKRGTGDYPPGFSGPHYRRGAELMAEETTVDLHGCEGEPAGGFPDDEVAYMERVTVPDEEEARLIFARYWCVTPHEVEPCPVFMRWISEKDAESVEEAAQIPAPDVPCWLECPADHPAAVPFWKDAP